MTPTATANAVTKLLRDFLEGREGARKFYGRVIGRDVNPDHCFADFLCCVTAAGSVDPRKRMAGASRLEKVYAVTKTALGESQGGTVGGYLVPQDLSMDLWQTVAEQATFRGKALVVPTDAPQITLPLPDAVTATGVSGVPGYFGGVQMTFAEEQTSLAETEPKLRAVTLKPWLLSGYAVASNPLVQDGGIEVALARLFGDAVAYFEDYYFINGTGVGQPLGVLTAAGLKVTRNASNLFKPVDAAGMVADLLPASVGRATWLISPTALAQLVQFTGWIPNGPMMLHGMEVSSSSKVPALGTLGDVTLTDPCLYVIAERAGLVIEASEHVNFLKNQMTYRVAERIDGCPWLAGPVTLADTTTQVASTVLLN